MEVEEQSQPNEVETHMETDAPVGAAEAATPAAGLFGGASRFKLGLKGGSKKSIGRPAVRPFKYKPG